MSFRTNFFTDELLSDGPPRITYGENVLINTVDRSQTALYKQNELLNQRIESCFAEGIERYQESQEQSAELVAEEIRWQAEQTRREIAVLGVDVTRAIHALGKFLGGEVSEVRWAVERNTEATKQILDVLLNSHGNESRQFYEEGVHWYDCAERTLAEECFEKAVKAYSKNAFAYEYLGFLAVHKEDGDQAKRYFDLALKSAPDDHHRAFAQYHLSRAWQASGDFEQSLGHAHLAVDLESTNTIFRYELVHALMRTGNVDQAIVELRRLILIDWKYWSVAAMHRLLDPIRAEVNGLLERMRREQRDLANDLLSDLLKTILLLDGLNDGNLTGMIASARRTHSEMQETFDKGTPYAYLEVVKILRDKPQQLILAATEIYQNCIEDDDIQLGSLISNHTKEVRDLEGQIAGLRQKEEDARRVARAREAELREANSKEYGDAGVTMGCLGCFSLVCLSFGLFMGVMGVDVFLQDHDPNIQGPIGGAIIMLVIAFFGLPRWLLVRRSNSAKMKSAISEILGQERRDAQVAIKEAESIEELLRRSEKMGQERIRNLREEVESRRQDLTKRINAMHGRTGKTLS